ncbi:hypothetical protein NJ7G_2592 [Natrinema sp. J7-2]|nr:hypothetical protein NJ7G_2592 [Natrinema sp. J7-2]
MVVNRFERDERDSHLLTASQRKNKNHPVSVESGPDSHRVAGRVRHVRRGRNPSRPKRLRSRVRTALA